MDSGGFDPRVAFLLLLVDSARLREPATPQFLESYLNALELRFPSGFDPDFTTDRYFDSGGMPLQLLINTRTMELRHAQAGNLDAVMPVLAQELLLL